MDELDRIIGGAFEMAKSGKEVEEITPKGEVRGGAKTGFLSSLSEEEMSKLKEMCDKPDNKIGSFLKDIGRGVLSKIREMMSSKVEGEGMSSKGEGEGECEVRGGASIAGIVEAKSDSKMSGGAKKAMLGQVEMKPEKGKGKKRTLNEMQKKRNRIISGLIKGKGMKLGQASKYLKEHPELLKE